jgi:hypothetical protein
VEQLPAEEHIRIDVDVIHELGYLLRREGVRPGRKKRRPLDDGINMAEMGRNVLVASGQIAKHNTRLVDRILPSTGPGKRGASMASRRKRHSVLHRRRSRLVPRLRHSGGRG